jgi:ferredoxin-NADP reductase
MNAVKTSSTYLLKLINRREVAKQTMAFCFEKPDAFTFTPGQWIGVTLLNPPENDAEGETRTFSIASAPHEDFIMVATRMRDTAFKRVLSNLAPGVEVKIDGPFGDLRLHNDSSRPAVVLNGGIGITPFRSILLHAAQVESFHRIIHFYANRHPEDAAFLEELQDLEKINSNYKLIACMTQTDQLHDAWQGETGVINAQMLAKYLTGVISPIYYLTGPPAMVKAMQSMLQDHGIDDDNIHMEEFYGY